MNASMSAQNGNASVIHTIVAASVLLAFECAIAQPSPSPNPSPGDISRQVAPERPAVLPAVQSADTKAPRPSAVEPGATTVKVRQWILEGSTLLSQERVDNLLEYFTNTDISVKQINEAAAWVQRAYEEDGWFVRVTLPEQDVTEGVVRIQVLEARLGEVVLDTEGATRVSPNVVQAIVNHPLSKGGVLNTRQVNRGLLLADDLAGVSVSGQLKSGQAEGTTDVLVRAVDEPAMLFEFGLDNGSARSVGEWRALGAALLQSPAGWGESYFAQALKSLGAKYLRLGASAPLGSSGLKGTLALSRIDYKVVTKDDTGVVPNIKGSAQTFGADLAYPLVRSRAQNLYVSAGIEQRDYDSFVDALKDNDYRVTAYSFGLSGNHFDSFGGASSNTYSVVFVGGRIKKLDPSSNNDPATLGNYTKVRWAVSRQQAVAKGLTFFTGLQGQFTGSKPLDTSENISLGGPSGVRAYPVGEASGPQGVIANLELRWALSPEWLITPFVDLGRVEKRTVDTLRAYSLRGTGISAAWTRPDGWILKIVYARRIGSNPNSEDNGKDQDGSLRKDRIWLSVNRSF
jgi:hemolysin activation/secretion protein